MHHDFRRAFGMVIVLALMAGEARAQYYGGYGRYGWGGWGGGGTVQGNVARGLGYYDMGAGVYNLDTAEANAINANTVEQWNQYMFSAQQQANQREWIRRHRDIARSNDAIDQLQKRLREEPNDRDIKDGDALNAALDQLSDPRIHSTALRLIKTPIPGKAIRDIPFTNASEAVTISLHQLTGESGWPVALQGPTFAAERKAYQDAVAKALKEDEEGDLSSQTLQGINAAASRLRGKLEANRPADKVEYVDAVNYIKGLIGMARMLEKPQVDKVLAELDTVKETSLGSLLGFMQTYNLRFGPATTDDQRAVYERLYPLLDEARDKVLEEAKAAGVGAAGTPPLARDTKSSPTDFFQGMHLEHLERRSGDNNARPGGDESKK